jgi:hypothetical protein
LKIERTKRTIQQTKIIKIVSVNHGKVNIAFVWSKDCKIKFNIIIKRPPRAKIRPVAAFGG